MHLYVYMKVVKKKRKNWDYRPDNISWRFCLHQRAPTYLLSILTAFRWMGALLHVSIREGTHLKSLPI